MPVNAVAIVAYAAGLLFGFGGALLPASIAALMVGAFATIRRSSLAGGAALVFVAGLGTAHAAARDDAKCLTVLQRRVAWRVLLEDRASAGAFVRGRIL